VTHGNIDGLHTPNTKQKKKIKRTQTARVKNRQHVSIMTGIKVVVTSVMFDKDINQRTLCSVIRLLYIDQSGSHTNKSVHVP
jgi:hypothetical protein